MTEAHPVHYIVKAHRNNTVAHIQEALDLTEAHRLKERFDAIPHTEGEIVEVHDPAETDLTTHTREIVEDIARKART